MNTLEALIQKSEAQERRLALLEARVEILEAQLAHESQERLMRSLMENAHTPLYALPLPAELRLIS